ncbi:TRAP transporter substrate-binding protein [Nesterenkonia muleiensis]|uniref:TRAP transporter substrate-binding protein n=1 Tax=Nesterenkonia muleiensis TaxID=2282648 RepID=UPI000E76B5EE|nr:TRAP transporter substrate-binding protein [Nesterenkonia muleiensis]
MNHKILTGLACTSALTLALTGCGNGEGGGDDGAALSLSLGHSYGVDSLQDRAAKELAENVADRTDGRLEISVYPASQLGSWEEMQEGLEVGSVDLVIESVGSLERYTDLAAIEGIPFLYADEEHFFEVWDGPLGEEIIEAIRDDSGFLLLGDMYRGPRVLNSIRPVEELSDLSGLRLRVPTQQTYIDTWEALGASPTPLALNEVFSAIEQGAIAGQENPIDVVRFNSFYEVAPYVTNTNHLYGNFHFQVWGDTYDSWDEELREVLDEEIAAISEWYRGQSVDEQEENISYLEDEGVEFFDIDYVEWQTPTDGIADEADPQVQEWVEQILH